MKAKLLICLFFAYYIVYDYATLTYTPGTAVTATCEITGCDRTYNATLFIPGYPYTVSYEPKNKF